MTTYLSSNFTLEELVASQAADRNGLDNTPTPEAMENLRQLCFFMEEVRLELGSKPIHVNSGYRSPAVNKAAGSTAKNSQHMSGQAMDFICPTFGTPKDVVDQIRNSALQYDQLILEFYNPATKSGWVHISWAPEPRRQTLVIDSKGTRLYD